MVVVTSDQKIDNIIYKLCDWRIKMANKKELKQYSLDSKEHCIWYLRKIIGVCEKCLDELKNINADTEMLLSEYNGQEIVPYNIYADIMGKSEYPKSYLLNVLGDAQDSSISYFKFRKIIEKRNKNEECKINISELSEKIKFVLTDFNKMRNWSNHIPESLLIAEMEGLKQKPIPADLSVIRILHYNYVTYEYFEDLYNENCNFYKAARLLTQSVKKDYSLLIGQSMSSPREYTDIPKGLEHLEASKKSSDVQGIKGYIPD